MKFRLTALLVAALALIAGFLAITPADASTGYLTLRNSSVVVDSNGRGYVQVYCGASKTCKGKIDVLGDTQPTMPYSYAVKARSYANIRLTMHPNSELNPARESNPRGTAIIDRNYNTFQYRYVSAYLRIQESYPKKLKVERHVNLQTKNAAQQIRGKVTGEPGDDLTKLTVEVISVLKGGNTRVVKFTRPSADGSYAVSLPLTLNNGNSAAYKLRIRKDGRAIYWRGTDGVTRSGGRHLKEASNVILKKSKAFVADFFYKSIRGNVQFSGLTVTVAAPPAGPVAGVLTRRDYDLPYCANVYGQATSGSSGQYQIDFLPYGSVSEKRYMVGTKRGAVQVWNGNFGSCLDTLNYRNTDTTNLIDLRAKNTQDLVPQLSDTTLAVKPHYSGFTPTTKGDRIIRLREKVPGVSILDTPVVAQRTASSSGFTHFTNVNPGLYWVETGRNTGCTDWLPSKYPNNAAYFNGADRGAESWKTVAGKYAESSVSTSHGYVPRNPPSGYKGWMYREYCKAYGTGTINTFDLKQRKPGAIIGMNATTNKKGAVVSGKITRTGGRTNKEMMVRLSSADGTRVVRTDVTDSSGRFYIAGLASGNWQISVNSDSWRGIGRTFSGKHFVRVTAGRSYSVGTLKFSS